MASQFATVEGTKSYAEKHSAVSYRALGNTNLLVSEAGFGTYRVDVSIEEHYNALEKALTEGINLVDTSSNYANGGSERLVGQVLQDLFEQGRLSREEVVLISKVGYIQGENLEISQARAESSDPFEDLVVFDDELQYCIHPTFLEDQLNRTLDRLQVTALDSYLLHNPEYILVWCEQQGVPIEQAEAEFKRRIKEAFTWLEGEVQKGRIHSYGVSSNTFALSNRLYTWTALDEMLEWAEEITPDHHFKIIEFPMNLYESQGAYQKNQGTGQTVLEFAQAKELGVLINRPLNAIVDNRLIRLTDVTGPVADVKEEDVSAALEKLTETEEEFRQDLLMELSDVQINNPDLFKGLNQGAALKEHWRSFGTNMYWQDVRAGYFVPIVQRSIDILTDCETMPLQLKQWIEKYVDLLNQSFKKISQYYRLSDMTRNQQVGKLVRECEPEWQAETLSQMAVRALRSTAGVTSVLVGMRQTHYVTDILADLTKPVVLKNRKETWQKLKHLPH